ncbi:GNAT family N-acetyltransferase [Undibacterium seohonense]|uniref:GNAT family N-acetyltransferase n=1 Tax=Undibacterium seohonense TaxID=1344950 RepID=A0ABR6XBC7_9BURK|nr:GNAT family N-acetyltransferase [Undibacterium seohonense]MBC3809579.1 GNAT family N-acetyltransferase [Undibacterium seohonense]
MAHLLDNIFWHSLSGAQACFATGETNARRYAKGFSPILGFADAEHPDFDAITSYCEPGVNFYCAGWTGAMPAGWQLHAEITMYRMVWDGDMPPEDVDFKPRRLDADNLQDAQQAMALAQLTNPGPFGVRTIALGEYLGCFDDDRLIAMAGERSYAPPYREVSGVCTHPDFQGKGLAKRLMHQIIRRQLLAKEIPFLHVMTGNTAAHELYLRMGFRDYCETAVRVVGRCE